MGGFLGGIAETVMGIFGIHDEDIYSVSMGNSRVFDRDTYRETRNRLILDKVINNIGSRDYILDYSKVGFYQFLRYLNIGRYDFVDYLPDVEVSANTVTSGDIINIIKTEKGLDNIRVENIRTRVLTDDEWCLYHLSKDYTFYIKNGILFYNNFYYLYEGYTHNINNKTFSVVCTPVKLKYSILEITKTRVTTKINNVTLKEYDEVTITVTQDRDYFDTNDIYIFTEKNIEISSRTFTTEVGEYTNSLDSIRLPDTYTELTNSDFTIVIPENNNEEMFIAMYTTSDGLLHYWLYNPKDNTYPELNNGSSVVKDIEAYPVVLLRNGYVDVVNYDKEGINSSIINEDRYNQSTDLLNAFGASIEEITDSYIESPNIDKVSDVFFVLGLCPKHTLDIDLETQEEFSKEAVAKALYLIFDSIYTKLPQSGVTKKYNIKYTEGVFNVAVEWSPSFPVEKEEVIGTPGTHTYNIITARNNNIKEYNCSELFPKGQGYPTNIYEYTTYTLTEYYDENGILIRTEKTDINTIDVNMANGADSPYYGKEGFIKTLTKDSIRMSPSLEIKKQIDETHTRTVIMYDLIAATMIQTDGGKYGCSATCDSAEFLMPLSVEVLENMSFIEQTALLGYVTHIQFYAKEHKHLEWYETSAFGRFLQIISIGITLICAAISFGASLPAITSISSALWVIAKSIIITLTVKVAIDMIKTNIDILWLKAVLTVAVTLVGMYATGVFDNFNISTAVDLAEIPVKIHDMYMEEAIKSLEESINAFSSEYEERLDVFKQISNELNSGLSVEEITGIMINTNNNDISTTIMTPSSYIYGALEAYKDYDTLFNTPYITVSNFVNNKLQLTTGE